MFRTVCSDLQMIDMKPVADVLFNYLRDVIYDPDKADLNVESLPEDFHDLGYGLQYFAECVLEANRLAMAMSKGDLTSKIPRPDNEMAAPLKSLHSSLRHLTWQAQQIAQGDYQQRVNFMGDFSEAFNAMAQQLEERRKLDTQEKSKLQQFINLILSNTPNILLAFDTEGKAVLASESYLRHSKALSLEEIQGKSFAELFSPVSTAEFLRSMDELFYDVSVNKSTVKIEQELDFGRDGNLRTYLIYAAPMLSENQKVIGMILVFDDMTEIVQAHHEAERARELAEQSSMAKSDFLARMSHEMRTPMNAIIGMAAIGKKTKSDSQKEQCFDNIGEASQHLLQVINDILDMSEIEAGKLELSYSSFSFEKMLDNVINIIRLQADSRKQVFTTDIDGNIPPNIISDERRLTQVILNLLSNAVKFTPEHGAITLFAKREAEADGLCTIRFTVRDTGIGISKEQQARLFVPFEQADGGRSRKFGGTGLGLAISKRIADMMAGDIWVESEFGNGASFTFELKVLIDEETDTDADAVEVSSSGIFAGKRILIAEDVEINREIIGSLLEDTGLEMDFALDGAEAVEKFSAAPDYYELVLMDIQMPSIDGYEATKLIRSSGLPGADKIPIVAMTANTFPEDIERSLASGMNAHLGKPVDIDEIIAKLKEYLL